MRRCPHTGTLEVFDDPATGLRTYFIAPLPMPRWGLSPELWAHLTQLWVVGECTRRRWHLGRHRLTPTNRSALAEVLDQPLTQ